MHLPLLIVGADGELRQGRALKIAKENSSIFDTNVLNTSGSAGIADVRIMNARLSHRPFNSPLQTAVILEAQNLTLEAQSALLKTLEEPPGMAKIILTAPTDQSLLSTVVSRCQLVTIAPSTPVKPDYTNLRQFLVGDLFTRYKIIDRLDLDLWTSLWREQLLGAFGLIQNYQRIDVSVSRLLKYIKLLSKIRVLMKRKASTKLLKTFLLMETPPLRNLNSKH